MIILKLKQKNKKKRVPILSLKNIVLEKPEEECQTEPLQPFKD